MATGGVTPLAELGGQGAVFLAEIVGFEVLETLMHQIEGVVDQLGGLFGGHGGAGGGADTGAGVCRRVPLGRL